MHPLIDLPQSNKVVIKAVPSDVAQVDPKQISLLMTAPNLKVSRMPSEANNTAMSWEVEFDASTTFSGKCYFSARLQTLGEQADPWLGEPVFFNVIVQNKAHSTCTVSPRLLLLRKSELLKNNGEQGFSLDADFVIKADDIQILSGSAFAWGTLLKLESSGSPNAFRFVSRSGEFTSKELPVSKTVFNLAIALPDGGTFYHPVFYFP